MVTVVVAVVIAAGVRVVPVRVGIPVRLICSRVRVVFGVPAGAGPKMQMLSMASLIAAHLPHLVSRHAAKHLAKPHRQEQLLKVDHTSITEVPDSLCGPSPRAICGEHCSLHRGNLAGYLLGQDKPSTQRCKTCSCSPAVHHPDLESDRDRIPSKLYVGYGLR